MISRDDSRISPEDHRVVADKVHYCSRYDIMRIAICIIIVLQLKFFSVISMLLRVLYICCILVGVWGTQNALEKSRS